MRKPLATCPVPGKAVRRKKLNRQTAVRRKLRFKAPAVRLGGLGLAVAIAAVLFLPACASKTAEGDARQSSARPPVAVLVGTVLQKDIPVDIQVIGAGESYATVSVKSQIQGEVEQAYFKPGQFVRKGDLLFTMDPSPFKAALAQAQANLAKDQAQLEYANSTLAQNAALYKEGIIARNQYLQYRSNAGELAAAVDADKAAIRTSQIQLGYCTIRAPLDGVAGAYLIDPGNVIQSANTALVVINQIRPIYVDFSVPQQYLLEIQKERALRPLRVEATIPHDTKQPEWGVLTFVNNTVDNTTGTIMLKGTFANSDRRLWPGQFVNVSLTLSELDHATVAPSAAVQTGQNGKYVYVVKPGPTVAYQPVTVGQVYQGYTEITKGLTPGETVVTDGQIMLYPGAKISIKKGL